MAKQLQVVLTAGVKDGQRTRLGLEAALAAVAAGLDVSLFFSLDAADWACATRTVGDADVYELIDQLQALGAKLVCCARCAAALCGDASGEWIGLAAGIEAVGLTQLMERVANGVPTVTF